jgi:hypothetical protein
MPKKIEDMVVSDKRRSIRDIPIPEGRRRSDTRSATNSTRASKAPSLDGVRKSAPPPPPLEDNDTSLPPMRTPIPRRRRISKKRVWSSVLVALLVLAFILMTAFGGATLSYVPKSTALTFEGESYTAQKAGTAGLFYSVVKLSREKGMAAPAGAEENVSRKASGVIIVYNNNAESQRLVENTRFESPSGKIYRIQNAITVPARRVAGGVNQPGSVEVTVYADKAGESYNSELVDFTIPGLKGTSRFTTVYARGKTPMTGGFVGRERVVSPEDLARVKTELQNTLKEELYTEAQAEVPSDFILFRTLSTFEFEDLPQSSTNGSSITVNQRGHLYGVMFKKSDLANYLAQSKITLAPNEVIQIPSYDSLNIAFAGEQPRDLLSLNEISFRITGATQAVWVTDEVAVKADLVGRSKKDIAGILNNYPTITSANVTLRPFWKSALPDSPEKIRISKLKP